MAGDAGQETALGIFSQFGACFDTGSRQG
jgi:hypothetical protein